MKLYKITFIRPNMGDYRSKDALTPLSIGILAALTPKDFEVKFYDDRVESIDYINDNPDLVAFSVETFTAKRAYDIAKHYRKKNIPVIMGGYHPTLMPSEVEEFADVVVIGDAEGIWEKIVSDFVCGKLQKKYVNENKFSLQEYKIDRAIFKDKKYLPVELIQYSRGCKYSCDFCSIHAFYKQNIRVREINDLVDELKMLDRKKLIFFVDDNLFSTKDNLYKLFEAIKPLKLRWSCQISIDVAKDDKILDAMRACGCVFVLIGFESLVDKNLEQMGKKWNQNSGDYLDVVNKFHQRNIAVYGTFVFGYDYDTLETIEESYLFAMEAKLEIANFNPLTPTPQTNLYERVLLEGRMHWDKWWLDENYKYGDAIYAPKNMKSDEFVEKCFEVKKRFYSFRSIFKRIILSKLITKPFLFFIVFLANIVSKIEIDNKQKRSLGK